MIVGEIKIVIRIKIKPAVTVIGPVFFGTKRVKDKEIFSPAVGNIVVAAKSHGAVKRPVAFKRRVLLDFCFGDRGIVQVRGFHETQAYALSAVSQLRLALDSLRQRDFLKPEPAVLIDFKCQSPVVYESTNEPNDHRANQDQQENAP